MAEMFGKFQTIISELDTGNSDGFMVARHDSLIEATELNRKLLESLVKSGYYKLVDTLSYERGFTAFSVQLESIDKDFSMYGR